MARRLVRTVRRVGADIVLTAGQQHRSIIEGWRATSGRSPKPTDSQKAPSFDAANKKALARLGVSGAARAVTSLAKRPAAADTVRGVNPQMAATTSRGSGSGARCRGGVLSLDRPVVVDARSEDEAWR